MAYEMRISDWSSDVCSSDLPAYDGPVLHVLDASRAVGVATSLVSDTGRDAFVEGYKSDYAHIRDVRANKGQSALIPIADARANGFVIDEHIRSEERIVGKGGVSTFSSRWAPLH